MLVFGASRLFGSDTSIALGSDTSIALGFDASIVVMPGSCRVLAFAFVGSIVVIVSGGCIVIALGTSKTTCGTSMVLSIVASTAPVFGNSRVLVFGSSIALVFGTSVALASMFLVLDAY